MLAQAQAVPDAVSVPVVGGLPVAEERRSGSVRGGAGVGREGADRATRQVGVQVGAQQRAVGAEQVGREIGQAVAPDQAGELRQAAQRAV